MSRLCVKALPPHATENHLRRHFGDFAQQLTEVRLMRTREGRSRHFAFLGFHSESDAAEALERFHRTFIGSQRIHCELAKPIGQGSAGGGKKEDRRSRKRTLQAGGLDSARDEAAANARQSQSARKRPLHDTGREDYADKGTKHSADFEEFASVLQQRSAARAWDNDAYAKRPRGSSLDTAIGGREADDASFSSKGSDASCEDDNNCMDAQETSDEARRGVRKDSEMQDASAQHLSDMDYLKSRATARFSDDDEGSTDVPAVGGSSSLPASPVTHARGGKGGTRDQVSTAIIDDQDEKLDESGRLFVRNLPYSCTEEDVSALFESCGELSDVQLITDDAGRSKGYAYVRFAVTTQAIVARDALDGNAFQGRLLHVMAARRRIPKGDDDEADASDASNEQGDKKSSVTFKQAREKERREQEVAGDDRAWHTLHTRSDTVVQSVSAEIGVSRSELMDRSSDNMAVRLALGETHVIAETKAALQAAGVSLSAVNRAVRGEKVARSNTTLLVKNLPFDTREDELYRLFSGRAKPGADNADGTIARIVLPPSRAIALIEFVQKREAKKAFRSLAFKKFKHVPLYLEWAPKDTFEHAGNASAIVPAGSQAGTDTDGNGLLEGTKSSSEEVVDPAPDASKPDHEHSLSAPTLFVKNLSFKTDEAALRDAFESSHMLRGAVKSVKVARKVNAHPESRQQKDKGDSMGYGFVEFVDDAALNRALKQLQGADIDGHSIELKRSSKSLSAAGDSGNRRRSGTMEGPRNRTKVVVRNVAFEASKDELRELLCSGGRLRSIRLPRKFDGSHRGFAFADFVSSAEAEHAMQTLGSTHLYGRRLVMEWAKKEEEGQGVVSSAARCI